MVKFEIDNDRIWNFVWGLLTIVPLGIVMIFVGIITNTIYDDISCYGTPTFMGSIYCLLIDGIFTTIQIAFYIVVGYCGYIILKIIIHEIEKLGRWAMRI